jgi:molybdopterin-containing oxidoreductase family membrane subunit
MVITLLIPLRKIYKFEHLITMRILEQLAKTIIFTGLIVGYAYAVEFFLAWYSGNVAEYDLFIYRAFGNYTIGFWIMVLCNSVVPLAFFFKQLRTRIVPLFAISLLVNLGMWFERYVIIASSPGHEFEPYSWDIGRIMYSPTWVEYGIMIGSFSLFFFFFLLFTKFIPSISIVEMKEMMSPPTKKTEIKGEQAGDLRQI